MELMNADLPLRLKPKVELFLEYGGKRLVDSELISILKAVRSTGSLLKASKVLSLPYSRVWERVTRAERELQIKLLEARRGGRGGARLTDSGASLIKLYEEMERELGWKCGMLGASYQRGLVIMGSHDPLLELVAARLRHRGEVMRVSWIGSAGGLAALMIKSADVAGVHLYDKKTGKYNEPYFERYWLKGRVVRIAGYYRELGLAYRKDKPLKGLRDLLTGKYRLANRNVGSGTRVMLEALLSEEGVSADEASKRIPGFETEYTTHTEVVEAVASGSADAGLTVRAAAEAKGLGFLSLKWELYEIVALKESLRKDRVRRLLKALSSCEVGELMAFLPGYRPL